MLSNRVAAPFSERLIDWQRQHGRHGLPWQGLRDPYRIWVSEIMLQQTQVGTVINYYQRFLQAFPEVRALAEAPLDDVLALWAGLGYYSRARNLHRAAQLIVDQHRGIFPCKLADIEALPGIGRSTAAAIAVFAFGTRAAILDANVKRVLARHLAIFGHLGTADLDKRLWQHAEDRLPNQGLESYTQGLMDLGAKICTVKNPRCSICPVAFDCVAYQSRQVDLLPTRAARKKTEQRTTKFLLICHQQSTLLERRPMRGIWGGLWSLPELPEQPSQELGEEYIKGYLKQHFGVVADVSEMPSCTHTFTHFKLLIVPLFCRVEKQLPVAMEPQYGWHAPSSWKKLGLPTPIKKLLQTQMASI